MQKTIYVLRWLAVAPGAAAFCIVAYLAIVLVERVTNWLFGTSPPDAFVFGMANFFAGFAAVYAAHYIAPDRKKKTEFVTCVVVAVAMIACTTLCLERQLWFSAFLCMCIAVGAFLCWNIGVENLKTSN